MTEQDVQRLVNASYVFGMAVGCQCEMISMRIENQERLEQGHSIAHDASAFLDLLENWGMNHNAIMTNLNKGI